MTYYVFHYIFIAIWPKNAYECNVTDQAARTYDRTCFVCIFYMTADLCEQMHLTHSLTHSRIHSLNNSIICNENGHC